MMRPKAKAASKRLPRRAADLRRARAGRQNRSSAVAKAEQKKPPVAENKSTESSIAERVVSCFKKFDVNGDGKISRSELTAVLTHLNSPALDVDMVMKEVDKNEDGVLDYAEFTGWLFEESELASEVLVKFATKVAEQTAAREQLELAQLHLLQAERAAEKPQPVDIWFEKADNVGLHFGKGDDRLSNVVTKATVDAAAYAAGVREAWLVLQVGDAVVKETSYIPDMLMEARLTGGVLVKFMPADAMERQRAAEASLPALRTALDQARAALEELLKPIVVEGPKEESDKMTEEKMKEGPESEPSPEEFGVLPPWVKVQYYDYKEPFHAPEGCLAASSIDEVFGLSDAMPKCKIILAEWRPGNTHILDYDDVDTGASPLVEEEGGIFRGLEAECLYFLLVQEDGESRKKEIAARRAAREAERLEEVRRKSPHDCAKEQVFGRLEVSDAELHPWVNGQYSFCGCKGPRPRFINTVVQPATSGRSILEFSGKWHIVASEDDFIPLPSLYTPKGDEPGFLPPSGEWPSCTDLSYARVKVNRKTVCKICDPRAGGQVAAHGTGVGFMGL